MTARISTSDRRLAVHRSGVGRWFGPSVDVPLAHVESVAVLDPAEAKRLFKGFRLVGIEIPGVMTAGMFRRDGRVTWWDVRRGRRLLVITLRDERISRLVIEVHDPAAVSRALDAASRGADVPSAERQR